MSEGAVLPIWLLIAVAVGTPALAFLGTLLGTRATRRGATELETRSKREETMRTLKWAAELAVAGDPAKADLGLRELRALGDSMLLDPEQQTFIDAALASVYGAAKPRSQPLRWMARMWRSSSVPRRSLVRARCRPQGRVHRRPKSYHRSPRKEGKPSRGEEGHRDEGSEGRRSVHACSQFEGRPAGPRRG
jgi:hypothetical protein